MMTDADARRDPIGRSDRIRAVVAATIGNGIEWFDFISFGFFTPYIARAFFPSENPSLSLILTWASYGLGIVVRPIAGAIIGVYGDRLGRRRVLSAIIMAMALGILILALTPSYATIGIAAPILVLLARILQGISATGEYSSGIAFLVEFAPPGRKFLYGSFQFVSQSLATVLATTAAFVVASSLSGPSLAQWGWRIPFLLGVLIGPIGFYIRRRVAESPEFAEMRRRRPTTREVSFSEFLRRNGWGVISAVAITIPGTVAVYLWFLYGPSFAIRELHLDPPTVNLITALCAVGLMLIGPLAGYLADITGPWRWFLPAVILLGVGAYPMFSYLISAPSPGRFLIVQAIAMVILGFIQGSTSQLGASFFPTAVRSSGLGLSFNLGVALFGGLAPLIVTALLVATGDKLVPAYYIIVAAIIAVILMAAGRFGEAARIATRRQEGSA
jgi:MFS transporter, MHS family, proline/betaine transporter